MGDRKQNILLLLLILALFVGGSMELSHGTIFVGVLFVIIIALAPQ